MSFKFFRNFTPRERIRERQESASEAIFANPEPVLEGSPIHPSMYLLKPWVGEAPAGFMTDWDGSRYVFDCLQEHTSPPEFGHNPYSPGEFPAPSEEMFEWIDLLESIRDADGSFTFVELGAGYGRWSIRAFNAARQRGIPTSNIRLVTVEAESTHSAWLRQNFELNAIPQESFIHLECAVSDWSGEGPFYVLQPGESDRISQAKEWYGQALVRADNRWDGAGTDLVSVQQLEEILSVVRPDTIIDLLDMDLQGEDSRVLESSGTQLSRIRKIHVGTDSLAEDARIFNFMSSMGWTLVRRYLPLRTVHTAYGPITFRDGVMTWINPNL